MPLPKMRPSFRVEASCAFDEAMSALNERMAERPEGVSGHFSRKHGMLFVTGADRRFWSPALDLTILDKQPDVEESHGLLPAVEVRGTFSPRPEIWTGLVFAIGTLTIVTIISFFFGIAQVLSGHAPLAFWVPVGAIPTIGVLYGLALIGQGLAADNMYQMRAYVDACLQDAEAASGRTRPLSPDASAQL